MKIFLKNIDNLNYRNKIEKNTMTRPHQFWKFINNKCKNNFPQIRMHLYVDQFNISNNNSNSFANYFSNMYENYSQHNLLI